jgi:tetratricopeptide (TPR) repeat protein
MIRVTCAALVLLATATRGAEAPPDERIAAYQEFRHAFDAAQYAAALPPAQRVVDLTRAQFGNEAQQLVNPLTNLGTTYYRQRNFGMALDSYREALTLLDLQGNATNEKLIRPLHGMGAALRGLQRDAEAIVPLRRAVEIIRNRDGLFAPAQLPLLKELIACYMSGGQHADAGREQQYAFNVAETSFGKNDLRLLEPLDDYARWNEAVGQYSAARLLHARAVAIADDKLGGGNLQAIPGLRGIARAYRLAFLNGETEDSTQAAVTLQDQLTPGAIPRLAGASSEGERSLRNALDRLTASTTPQPQLRGAVLIDLGDWYMTGGAASRAIAAYRDAWQALGAEDAAKTLGMPSPIVYRPPTSAVSRQQFDPETHDEQEVQLRLAVEADGDVREAIVANPAPEREAAEKAVISAVKHGLWRPGFRDGQPVAMTDVEFRERVFIRKPKEKDKARD